MQCFCRKWDNFTMLTFRSSCYNTIISITKVNWSSWGGGWCGSKCVAGCGGKPNALRRRPKLGRWRAIRTVNYFTVDLLTQFYSLFPLPFLFFLLLKSYSRFFVWQGNWLLSTKIGVNGILILTWFDMNKVFQKAMTVRMRRHWTHSSWKSDELLRRGVVLRTKFKK